MWMCGFRCKDDECSDGIKCWTGSEYEFVQNVIKLLLLIKMFNQYNLSGVSLVQEKVEPT